MKAKIAFIFFILLCACNCQTLYASTNTKGVYQVTASSLNVRSGASINSRVIGTVTYGEKYQGEQANIHWVRINYKGQTAYISTKYSKLIQPAKNLPAQKSKPKKRWRLGFGWWLFIIFIGAPAAIGFLSGLWKIFVDIIGSVGIFYIMFYIVLLPFRFTNWLQHFLHKPWRMFQRHSWQNDSMKGTLRVVNFIFLIPLYIILTPVRFLNAVSFNMVHRVISEFWNYLCEVINPDSYDEGADNFFQWIIYFPWRFIKYPVYHGILTLIECAVFTVVDTIYPAMTLYHGTSADAADAIVSCPTRFNRNANYGWMDGVWNVGGGNYAGDGIYFASAVSTSRHYARSNYSPVIIICRVSLGLILPLSLAPWHVYSSAGHPNAHAVTKYGLDNGYTSIEWWRKDSGWWEYCLLDWQNKYNESWRIRPIMVLNLESHFFKRIAGGSRHWLFDSQVIQDLEDFFTN